MPLLLITCMPYFNATREQEKNEEFFQMCFINTHFFWPVYFPGPWVPILWRSIVPQVPTHPPPPFIHAIPPLLRMFTCHRQGKLSLCYKFCTKTNKSCANLNVVFIERYDVSTYCSFVLSKECLAKERNKFWDEQGLDWDYLLRSASGYFIISRKWMLHAQPCSQVYKKQETGSLVHSSLITFGLIQVYAFWTQGPIPRSCKLLRAATADWKPAL